MIRFMLGKIKCFFGFHEWSNWNDVSATSCEQIRTCGRCAQKERRPIEHIWEKWDYIKPNRCEQVQFCRRCNAEGSDINMYHKWTEWKAWNKDPDGNNSYDSVCRQRVRTCTRCKRKEIERAGHSWEEKIGFDYLVCTYCKRFSMNSPPPSSRHFEVYKSYPDRDQSPD